MSSNVPAGKRPPIGRRYSSSARRQQCNRRYHVLRHLTTSNCRLTRKLARATTFYASNVYLLVGESTQTNRDRRFNERYPEKKTNIQQRIQSYRRLIARAGRRAAARPGPRRAVPALLGCRSPAYPLTRRRLRRDGRIP